MADILVTTLTDVTDATDGELTLREAVAAAAAGDRILFEAGLSGTLTLTQGEIDIARDLTISGDNTGDLKADIVISGGDASRIFDVVGGVDVDSRTELELRELTLTQGLADIGGAIRSDDEFAQIALVNSSITDSRSTASGLNSGGGGAVYATNIYAMNVTFSGNSAGNAGGGLYLKSDDNSGSVLNNVTFHDNSAAFGGAVYLNNGLLYAFSTTISGNTATQLGGGIASINGSGVSLYNTVIAQNTAGLAGEDISDNDTTAGFTVFNSFFGSNVTGVGTLNLTESTNGGGDAGLGPLQDNGGPVRTMAPGAPLIDAGQSDVYFDILDSDGDGESFEDTELDANGNPRVVRAPDIGAVERQPFTWIVDDFSDVDNGNLDAGDLTLREAIGAAIDGDTITFATGGTVGLTSRLRILEESITIDGDVDGDGVFDVTIQQTGNTRVLEVADFEGPDDQVVELRSLRLTGGANDTDGGGLNVSAGARVNLVNAQIDGNSAGRGGGVAVNADSTLFAYNSLISENFVTGELVYGAAGGGVFNIGTVRLYNTTLARNGSDPIDGDDTASGAGVFNSGQLLLAHSTVTDNIIFPNDQSGAGGGIHSTTGLTLNNSIVSGNWNYMTALDIVGTYAGGGNVVGGTPGDVFLTITGRGGGALSTVAGAPTQVAAIKAGGPADGIAGGNVLPGDTFDIDGDGDIVERIDVDATLAPRVQYGAADAGAVEAQPVIVTTDQDEEIDNGETSLREAIAAANGNQIRFHESLTGATLVLTGGELAIDGTSGDVFINGDIDGDGKADVAISGDTSGDGVAGAGDTRIFNVAAGQTLALDSLTLANGYSTGNGGAITAAGTLRLRDVTVRDSIASSGGGIYLVTASTLLGTAVTFSGNVATSYGGGLYARGTLDSVLTNATFSGNSATAAGGGISQNGGTLTLQHATVSDNSAAGGGGIENFTGNLSLVNSVVAGNTATTGQPDILVNDTVSLQGSFTTTAVQAQTITNNGGNIFSDADPGLGALADTGGTVQTMAVLGGSPLNDAAGPAPADALDIDRDGDNSEALPLAANGVPRTFGTAPEIGAFETAPDTMNLVVDTLTDEDDGDYGVGDLSLREAITLADPGATITFQDGMSGSIVLTQGSLVLSQGVTIDGDTDGDLKADITLDGGGTVSLVDVTGSADVKLVSLTLANGSTASMAFGGALSVRDTASATLIGSTVRDSVASIGGGINVLGQGELTLVNSTVSGNEATGFFGGGIFLGFGTYLTAINTTVAENLVSNAAGGYGGGIFASVAVATLANSTIAGNTVASTSGQGGGFSDANFAGGSLTIRNSIISGNTAATIDDLQTEDAPTREGANIIGTDIFVGDTDVGDTELARVFVTPGGKPALIDNGGPVETVLMRFFGDHMNLGDPAFIPVEGQDTDGDGVPDLPAPVDARLEDRAVSGRPDLGATEFQTPAIAGTPGDDPGLTGTASDDLVMGLTGDDTLRGLAGADQLIGGLGHDTADYGDSAQRVVINLAASFAGGGDAAGDTFLEVERFAGSALGDVLSGDTGANTFDGGAGNDTLRGWQGDDVLEGGPGGDSLDGASGNDTVAYTQSADRVIVNLANGYAAGGDAAGDTLSGFEHVVGSARDDILAGDANANTLTGGAGNDQLRSWGGSDALYGGANDDFLEGGPGGDMLFGGPGEDTAAYTRSAGRIVVNLSADYIGGGDATGDMLSGVERIVGSAQGDVLAGDGNSNTFDGGAGIDILRGWGGDDYLEGGAGGDSLDGAAGNDTVAYTQSANRVVINLTNGYAAGGDAAGDTLSGFEHVVGSAQDDILAGNGAANTISGGAGADQLRGWGGSDALYGGSQDDVLDGGPGGDMIFGGAEFDTVDYSRSAGRVVINLGAGFAAGGDATGDVLSGIERITGSAQGDILAGNQVGNGLFGGDGPDILRGWGGNDRLVGGAADDFLDGGQDNDNLVGNAGSDTFFFRPGWRQDVIEDYEDDIDQIDLTVFGFADANAALALALQTGPDVVFDFGGGDILTVRNATKAELQDDLLTA